MQKINHIFVKKIKMKHTEPKIGQLVYVINKDIFVKVIDKESIEGITLFYTDDKLSYIEEQLYYVNGSLVYKQNKVKKPINGKSLLSALQNYYKNDTKSAEELTKHILDSREEKIKETIIRKVDK